MKIEMNMRTGTLVEIKLNNGKVITEKDIENITMDPYFTRRSEVVEFATLTSKTADGRKIDDCGLTVSGSNGRVLRRENLKVDTRVAPAIDDAPTASADTNE